MWEGKLKVPQDTLPNGPYAPEWTLWGSNRIDLAFQRPATDPSNDVKYRFKLGVVKGKGSTTKSDGVKYHGCFDLEDFTNPNSWKGRPTFVTFAQVPSIQSEKGEKREAHQDEKDESKTKGSCNLYVYATQKACQDDKGEGKGHGAKTVSTDGLKRSEIDGIKDGDLWHGSVQCTIQGSEKIVGGKITKPGPG